MSEEAQREFEKFNWSENNSWQQYYNNLYPTPTSTQLKYFKRKWFKKNINSRLELEENSESNDNVKGNESRFGPSNNNEKAPVNEIHKQIMVYSLLTSLLLSVILSIINFFPLIKNNFIIYRFIQLCNLFFIIGFGINLYEVSKKPIKFLTIEFWQGIIIEDSFHSLLSLFAYYGLTFNFPMIYIIPSVTAIFILSKYQHTLGNKRLNSFFTIANQKKNKIYERRAFFEAIGLGLYLILSTITRRISILYLSFYWALIRSKYPFDPYIQYAYRVTDNKINYYLNAYSNHIPNFIPRVYKTVSYR
ncbi:hypothetical protein FG386_003242 [Cryptosporidium ryanae]|uniref:uncharacterized protein n=1 Tax=Cryptosporidium ryanae TaxID=515981 RepID=UPI003519DB1E|nr:hypothetical protein FG386_003242 [Cryptosporidium ryanae]